MKEDVPLFFKEPSGKVAFAGIGEEDDDAFILEYGALSDLDCGVQGCAAGNPDKYAGFSGCVSGCVTGVGCRNRHDFVDEIHVQNGGDESGTDALELVWAGVFAGNYCAAIGFDGGDMDLRQYFFSTSAHPVRVPPVPTPATKQAISLSVSRRSSKAVVRR